MHFYTPIMNSGMLYFLYPSRKVCILLSLYGIQEIYHGQPFLNNIKDIIFASFLNPYTHCTCRSLIKHCFSLSENWFQLLSHIPLFATPWTVARQVPWDSPVKNTGVGYHSLLQGIFPTQGSNLDLPHFRQILNQLRYRVQYKAVWLQMNFKPLCQRQKSHLFTNNLTLYFRHSIISLTCYKD